MLESPKGRIGLVSTASTFRPNAGANDALGDVPARAGIRILRSREVHLVSTKKFAQVKALATELASPLAPAPAPQATEVELFDTLYRLSQTQALHYDMDLYDEAGLLKAVRDAKETCDLVVFTIHAHESPTGVDDDTPQPPDFLVKLFHDCVDAGADVILGRGPTHSLRGVEIYHGKPPCSTGWAPFSSMARSKPCSRHPTAGPGPDATGHAPPPPPEETASIPPRRQSRPS